MFGRLAMLAVMGVVGLVESARATVANDLCAANADPCIVNTTQVITPLSVLDFGNREFQLKRPGILDIQDGSITIRARRMRIVGGKILGHPLTGNGGSVSISVTQDFRFERDGTTMGLIDLNGFNAGNLSVEAGTDIFIDGPIDAEQAGDVNGFGGNIFLTGANVSTTVNGDIMTDAATNGGSGDVSITANGAVSLAGELFMQGGQGGGGNLTVTATGAVTFSAPVNVSALGAGFGDGGSIDVTAGADVTFNALTRGQSSGDSADLNGAGVAADVSVLTPGNILVNDVMTFTGATPDGEGGDLDFLAGGNFVQANSADINANGTLGETCGGRVTISAGGTATVNNVNAYGGSCGGGEVFIDAGSTVDIRKTIDATGTGGTLLTTAGGQVVIASGNLLTLQSTARIRTKGDTPNPGGVIEMSGCTIQTQGGSGVVLDAGTLQARIKVSASGQLTWTGVTATAAEAILMEYRNAAQVPSTTGTYAPSLSKVQNANLLACGLLRCGNGQIDGTETCDEGTLNGGTQSCCSSSCGLAPSGTVCRAAVGACDAQETCNGTSGACPANAFQPAGTSCRAAAGLCDVGETCLGNGPTCPPDLKVPNGTQCRASAGSCDAAEACNGTSNDCPIDVVSPNGIVCRPSVGGCDAAETCNGVSGTCPADVVSPNGTVCRAATGLCDVAEVCNGSSGVCPADTKQPAGTVCRLSVGGCDATETCDGSSGACPADGISPAGTVCRPAAGDCDVAEQCNGSSGLCPSDVKSTGVCRPAASVCDFPESCNGSSNSCPPDAVRPAGFECRASAGDCDIAEQCDGTSGDCPADAKRTGVCRAAGGACDAVEQCDGLNPNCPADQLADSATICRPSAGSCDAAEHCTGSSAACPADAKASAGTECRTAAGACDIAETCDGSSNDCPANVLESAGVECRAAGGDCDVAESCDGSSPTCPADAKATGQCRAAAGDCDVAESCDGLGNACPPDQRVSSGTECRAAAGACDLAEQCNGGVSCPADQKRPSGATCRGAASACDAVETCDGSSDTCPADGVAPSGTVCRAAIGACDIAETCDGSASTCPTDGFQPASFECRPSTGACDPAETCSGSGPVCPADVSAADQDSDTVCDASDNCPAVANAGQENGDSDALGDACDACTGGGAILTPKLKIAKLVTPGGDDTFKLTGLLTLATPPAIDPIARGFRLVLSDTGGTIADVPIPAGALDAVSKIGWRANAARTSFTFKHPLGVQGITKVVLKVDTKRVNGFKLTVSGKKGTYPVASARLPVHLIVVTDTPNATTGQCAEHDFTTPACAFDAKVNTFKCK